jgi:glycosyltransferase involved in cell wall biosynthesis
MKLSILICSLPERAEKLKQLLLVLSSQAVIDVTEVLINATVGIKIGDKRNRLIEKATGDYVCFIDDDDLVSNDYNIRILNAIETKPDCVGIQGVMLTNANCPRRFFHTIESSGWYTNGCEYFRTPNHLNPIKRSIVKQVMFNKFSSFGEDMEFAFAVSSLLKTEVMIDDPIYYYVYNTKPNERLFT